MGPSLLGLLPALGLLGCSALFPYSPTLSSQDGPADSGSAADLDAPAAIDGPNIDGPNAFATYQPISPEEGIVVRPWAIAAAAGGAGFAVAWEGFAPGESTRQLFVSRVTSSGKPLGAPIGLRGPAELRAVQLFPAAAGGYLAFYSGVGEATLWSAHILADGAAEPPVEHSDRSYGSPDVAAGPAGFLAVYVHKGSNGRTQFFSRAFDPAGHPAAPEQEIEPADTSQYSPRLARVVGAYALTWQDQGSKHLRLAWLEDGGALSAASSEPALPATSHYQPVPYAFGDDALCAVYSAGGWQVHATARTTGPLWTEPLALVETRFATVEFALANSPQGLGIAWASDEASVLPQIAFAMIDRANGIPASSAARILTDSRFGHAHPQLAWDGQRFAVVFTAAVGGTRGLFLRFAVP